MLPFEDQFTRQRQLREVGLAGQRRIEASSVAVGHGAADLVAADYLKRAGVQVRSTSGVCFVPLGGAEMAQASEACTFSGPAHYLAGTLAALAHLRSVLGLGDVSSGGRAEHETEQRAARGEATRS